MGKLYQLVIVWESGEREIYEYASRESAIEVQIGMQNAFGKQIGWMGIREKRWHN